MTTENYLSRSRLFRRLKNGPDGQYARLFASRLVKGGFSHQSTWRSLHLIDNMLDWMRSSGLEPTELMEHIIEQYLRHRAINRSIHPGDRASLKRLLSVLREADLAASAMPVPRTPHEKIFADFSCYLDKERGLAPTSIVRHLPVIRQFLLEVCPGGTSDLNGIGQEAVIGYVERHAKDWSTGTGKAMCWALRAFLRYLHCKGFNQLALADCVPSIKSWRCTNLPTYLTNVQVQKVLDSCDQATAMGQRDYAVLMILARLGMRAGEVATLTLDDIDWRSGEMLIRAKGRRRARMPIPPDVGSAIVTYLRNGRPASNCRRLFLRTLAPNIGFASGCAVTMIAKTALLRADICGFAHQGAHIFRHSLATELLRSGATLAQIGQLLRHQSHDSTRIYAKVDIETLRTLSQPWPGGVQ